MSLEKISDPPSGIENSAPPQQSAGWTGVATALSRVLSAVPAIRAARVLAKVNKVDGFDCPGCAWPDPEERSRLGEFCENGAKAIAEEATTKLVDESFFAAHSVEHLFDWSDLELGSSGRLAQPVIIRKGETHYTPIDWRDAFNLIGDHLRKLDSPDEAIFYTSGRTSNEAAFLYQLFARAFGTNNLPDCSNMCHESSGAALAETVGIGKGSVTLEDFYEAEVILIAGQNPGTNHPRMLSALEKAKENGATIIAINPLSEAGLSRFKNPQRLKGMVGGGTQLCDILLQIRINGDVALIKALLIGLLAEEAKDPGSVLDLDFINELTSGFDELRADLSRYTVDDLCDDAGVTREQVDRVVSILAKSTKIICCWAMGLTQHVNAVDNIREYVNLLLAKGAIGKRGAGTCPVRGHSNVQGDRTVGICERPPQHLVRNLSKNYGITVPAKHGYDTVAAIAAMASGQAKVFLALGGNFLSASPDTSLVAQGLRSCSLTVQVSTKLNRSHLAHGETALILPCLSRSDIDSTGGVQQFVTVENSMGRVHRSKGVVQPASKHLLSEVAIVCGVANETLQKIDGVDWEWLAKDYDRIRDLIEMNIPGFDDYNLRVRQENGFYLPNGARARNFNTPTGKATFTVNELPATDLKEGEFMMMTIRSHDQFNTTVYSDDDRYRGIKGGRKVILINPDDLAASGLDKQQNVDILSEYGGQRRSVQGFKLIPYDIPRRCVATYFPECNPLVPLEHKARISNTPASKLVVVKLISGGPSASA